MLWRRLFTTLRRGPATLPAARLDEVAMRQLADRLEAAAQRRLGRSLAIRHLNAGGCNGCELEIRMLTSIAYDLERFGLRFVASPRHADVLLVTGPVTRTMQDPMLRAWNAMAEPKWVVAVGDCAVSGGLFAGSYACVGPASAVVPVSLAIPGCPPTPTAMLKGLLTLLRS